ncbi:MAG: Superoxide dismutase [Microgenomates group bacterium GW2011_GWC1_41_8]|nr:MAG: Superoxide dismutase [Candidatus Roizmanbacteria bacterium GW2011_GWA1_41_13]KKS23038.1 MAG: Superoxide dismutase [Microgenomates group bacterium GW2011_GWC1_41_8]KKS23099.1 MAG: Superoxide dismutase [Candidatus Roizmanbacteria bacterium GW2011_GWC2_41_7]
MLDLPNLPYAYDALEPVISKKIMELHHDKHHAAYVAKANAALEGTEWADKSIEEILKNLSKLPKDKQTAVRNNGGGHANHSLFWKIMRTPQEDNKPSGAVRSKLEETFGSFEKFKTQLSETATGQFGSGWGWLVKKVDGDLTIYSLPNQDSPILTGDMPIVGIDVWEHAYYLDYLNDRAAYIEKWWHVVNWDEVEKRL